MLLLIYTIDLADDIIGKVLRFADDTKVLRNINNDANKQHLTYDLNKLIEWSDKRQMFHLNENAPHTMGGTVVNTTVKQKEERRTTGQELH